MARYFEIKKNDTSTVKLDSQGHGSVQYKFKNVSPTPTDGRAVLTSIPKVSPPAGVVQNGWVKIDGPTDHHFNPNEEYTFNVKIEIPQKDRSKAGNYTFEVDAALVSIPDVITDEGPATAFTIAAASPAKKPSMLAWLIPVIVVVLIGLGVGAWLLLRGGGKKVPDVTGKNMTDAVVALADTKLTVDPKVDTVSVDRKLAGKVVTQNPAPGTPVVTNGTVRLTIGASKTVVPLLNGKTVAEAQEVLGSHQLALGDVTNSPNPGVTAGLIYNQSQVPGTEVDTNTSVNVTIAPQQVKVPNVVGKTKDDAISAMRLANLQIGNMVCDQLNLPIVNQNPAPDTPANVGSNVTVIFPCSPNANARQFTYFKGSVAHESLVASPAARSMLLQPVEKPK